ncbi:hypothetical protein [Streptomyces sp. SID3212]|uniref:hypothetical protein n=1 Tax=Streptomyces sp. SID3212 TaxID=2690259 RepID=UPI00136F44EB|nr:hypothetical protein [Streptomyces sp. SID3212]MYV56492.1 hypothetical protein [Streptomyces sp. SID3212]
MRSEPAVTEWLLSSQDHPRIPLGDWSVGRPALLRGGRAFDAVRMRAELVHAAIGCTAPADVAAALAELLDGPVIADPGSWYYGLVPPRTTETWRSSLAVVLGSGSWIVVPVLTKEGPAGPYWAVPPAQYGTLCDPQDLAELLRVGDVRLGGVAP